MCVCLYPCEFMNAQQHTLTVTSGQNSVWFSVETLKYSTWSSSLSINLFVEMFAPQFF